ncbi:MAG: extracellular solute-binding protein [Treponema sp.]|jgi:multiple sugar transport system substrate-binding protein|nr:extracellular solute-binding protein [Treponema sp.]
MKLDPKKEAQRIIALIAANKDYALLVLALIVLVSGIISAALRLSQKTGPVLVFTQWWDKEPLAGTLESLIGEYRETNKNIKIVLKSRSYNETRKMLLDSDYSAYTAGTDYSPGDILAVDGLWIHDLYENGVLDPSYPPSEPLISFFYPFFYNIEMLKNAGFSRPPKTRSELLSMAEATGDPKNGVYGIAFALGADNPSGVYRDIYPWFWASGVSLTDGGRPFQETLDFFSRLNQGGAIHRQTFSMSEEEKLDAFIKNKIAFMTGRMQSIETLRKKMGDGAFGISIVPGADSYIGKPALGVSDWSLGIFSGSKHKEEARAFIEFLLEKSPAFAEKINIISGSSLSPELTGDPFYSKAWELYIDSDLVREFSYPSEGGGEPLIQGLSGTERDKIFQEELFALFEGSHTPAAAATAIRERWGIGN